MTGIRLTDGHCVGTLCVVDHKPRQLDDAQRDILRALAQVAASALEGRRALAAAADEVKDLYDNATCAAPQLTGVFMPWLKPALWLVAIVFAAFSLWVFMQIGYLGIWQGGFANLGSMQITADLVIACTIGMGFIARDCREKSQAWWPWALLTLALGSIGLLAYLLWPRR